MTMALRAWLRPAREVTINLGDTCSILKVTLWDPKISLWDLRLVSGDLRLVSGNPSLGL